MKNLPIFFIFFFSSLFINSFCWGQDNKKIVDSAIDKMNYEFAVAMFNNICDNAPSDTDEQKKDITTYGLQKILANQKKTHPTFEDVKGIVANKQTLNTPTKHVFKEEPNYILLIEKRKEKFNNLNSTETVKEEFNATIRWITDDIIREYNNFPSHKYAPFEADDKADLKSILEKIKDDAIKKLEPKTSQEKNNQGENEKTIELKAGLGSKIDKAKKDLREIEDNKISHKLLKGSVDLCIYIKNETNIKPINIVKEVVRENEAFTYEIEQSFKKFLEINVKFDPSKVGENLSSELKLNLTALNAELRTITISLEGYAKASQNVVRGDTMTQELSYTLEGEKHDLKVSKPLEEDKYTIKYDEQITAGVGDKIIFYLDNESIETLTVSPSTDQHSITQKNGKVHTIVIEKEDNSWIYWLVGSISLAVLLLIFFFILLPILKPKNNSDTNKSDEEMKKFNKDLEDLKIKLKVVLDTKQSSTDRIKQANSYFQEYGSNIQQDNDVKFLMDKIKIGSTVKEEEVSKIEIQDQREDNEVKNAYKQQRTQHEDETPYNGNDEQFSTPVQNENPKKAEQPVITKKPVPSKVYGKTTYLSFREITEDGRGVTEGEEKPVEGKLPTSIVLVLKPYKENNQEYAELSLYENIVPSYFSNVFRNLNKFDNLAIIENPNQSKREKLTMVENGEGILVKEGNIWIVDEKKKLKLNITNFAD